MNLLEFEKGFKEKLGNKYVTKDVDKLNKELIKRKIDVSFLKDIILIKQDYHRTYFQVSLGLLDNIDDQLNFIEDNFDKLNDWWHVDQLEQFISKNLTFEIAFSRALKYINCDHEFTRRWGYVIFMPKLVKDKSRYKDLFKLFKNDDKYYVIMAEAWLISYLGIYYPEDTLEYLKNKPLDYHIVGKGIQKICDSFRISDEYKSKFKEIRKLYK